MFEVPLAPRQTNEPAPAGFFGCHECSKTPRNDPVRGRQRRGDGPIRKKTPR